MERVYKYQNGIIYVSLPNSYNQDHLIKMTEKFLKKVISEEIKNGNSNSSRDFREK